MSSGAGCRGRTQHGDRDRCVVPRLTLQHRLERDGAGLQPAECCIDNAISHPVVVQGLRLHVHQHQLARRETTPLLDGFEQLLVVHVTVAHVPTVERRADDLPVDDGVVLDVVHGALEKAVEGHPHREERAEGAHPEPGDEGIVRAVDAFELLVGQAGRLRDILAEPAPGLTTEDHRLAGQVPA